MEARKLTTVEVEAFIIGPLVEFLCNRGFIK